MSTDRFGNEHRSWERSDEEKQLDEIRRILRKFATYQWGDGATWGRAIGLSNSEQAKMKKFLKG